MIPPELNPFNTTGKGIRVYDSDGNDITPPEVRSFAAKSGLGGFDLVEDSEGFFRAVPKGARNVSPQSLGKTPYGDFWTVQGIMQKKLGANLLTAHLNALSTNSRLGGKGSLASIVSALGKAGIDLAGTGFGPGTVAASGGGRKRGKGRGSVNIKVAQNMLNKAQAIDPVLMLMAQLLGIPLPQFPSNIPQGRGSVPDVRSAFFSNAAMNADRSRQVRDSFVNAVTTKINELSSGAGVSYFTAVSMIQSEQGITDIFGMKAFNERATREAELLAASVV